MNMASLNRMHLAGLDPARIRADFPGLSQTVRGKPLVYLDNAATTQKPKPVLEAILHHYTYDHANVHRGVHALSERSTEAFEGAREQVRAFINARDRREIIFVRGTTEAINLVAQTFGQSQIKTGDEVLITEMEHHSNIVPWQMLCQQTGATLKVAPVDDHGVLKLDAFESLLNHRTRLVGVIHVSNALGTINPVKEIVARARTVGAKVLVDGAQAVAHLGVDVQDLDCDFYAFSGHKLYGPTGIGVLYGKAALLEAMPPYQGGGEMIRTVSFDQTVYAPIPAKFEAGTPHIVGAIGLGAAIDYVTALGLEAIGRHEGALLQYATETISQVPGIQLIGTAPHKSGVLSFTLRNAHPHDIGTILDSEGVAVRSGHHCAMPLMKRYCLPATTRASFAVYNTHADIDALAHGLAKVQEILTR